MYNTRLKISYSRFFISVLCVMIYLITFIDIFVDKPHFVLENVDGINVDIQLNRTNLVLPDSWAQLEWSTSPSTTVTLNGIKVENTGIISQAFVGEYQFIVQSPDDSEYVYDFTVSAWIHDKWRVAVTIGLLGVTTIIFLFSIWHYVARIYSSWNLFIQPDDNLLNFRFATRQTFVIEISFITALTLLVHIILWNAWPPHFGADARSYISLYVNVFESEHLVDFSLIYIRGLLPSVVHGWSLAQGYSIHIFVQSFLATTSALILYLIARPWGRGVAGTTLIIYLLYLPLQLFFHQVSSEGVFVWTTLFAVLMLQELLKTPTLVRGVFLGAAIGLCVLTRPTGILLFPLVTAIWLIYIPLWKKIQITAAVIIFSVVVVAPWVAYRGIKYNYWTLYRPQGTFLFTSSYTMGLIQTENGVASQELSTIIEENILTFPSYRQAGITIDNVYHPTEATEYLFYSDILYYLDTYMNWEAGRELLERAGFEALNSNRLDFLINAYRFISSTFLRFPTYIYIPDGNYEFGSFHDNSLTKIPRYSYYTAYPPYFNRPDEHIVAQVRYAEDELLKHLVRKGNEYLAQQIVDVWLIIAKFASLKYIFYPLTIITLLSLKRRSVVFWTIVLGTLIAIAGSSVIVSPEIRYRMPLDPFIIVTTVVGGNIVVSVLFKHLAKLMKSM